MRTHVLFTLQKNLRTIMRRMKLSAIRSSQLVQVDRLVYYPLVFIHIRLEIDNKEIRQSIKKVTWNRYLFDIQYELLQWLDKKMINGNQRRLCANCDVIETNACTFMLCNGVVKFWREVTIQLGG